MVAPAAVAVRIMRHMGAMIASVCVSFLVTSCETHCKTHRNKHHAQTMS